MIVFDLECREGGHRFEGWFGSSASFDEQQALGLLDCPQCGSAEVTKAPMAPRLARKGNQQTAALAKAPAEATPALPGQSGSDNRQTAPVPPTMPPQVVEAIKALAVMQAEALKRSRWVGPRFAQDVRAMHYGDHEAETVHGQATAEEAQELLDEGIAILPLPFPVAPPDELN